MRRRPLLLALAGGLALALASVIGCSQHEPKPAAAATLPFSARPVGSSSARLQAALPRSASDVEIRRDGRLLDRLHLPSGELVYTDFLLWPKTSYQYQIRVLDQGGALLASATATVTTQRQTQPFPRLYSPASFWNRPISPQATADPHSGTIVVRTLAAYASSASLVTSDKWGRPVAYASDLSPAYPVRCTRYDCDRSVSFRIPAYATPATGTDHHLVVIDSSTAQELDMWLAARDPQSGEWSAGSRFVTASDGWGAQCGWGSHCHGAVAAGMAAFGGVVRPEEIAQGHIDHALVFADPYTRRAVIACPATYTDGISDDAAAIPEGARIQLDPAVDVEAQPWPRWEKIIAHALQTYGAYVGDTGGSLGFVGEARLDRGYDPWMLAGVPEIASLSNLPWNRCRVMQMQFC